MGITSDRLKDLELIDGIIPEPLGGCHRDRAKTAENLKASLKKALDDMGKYSIEDLVSRRYRKIMSYGVFEEASA